MASWRGMSEQCSDRSWWKTDQNHRRDGERNRSDFRREWCGRERRVDSSCRKRPREEKLTDHSFVGSRGGTHEPFPKKFHLSSGSDHMRSDRVRHDMRHRSTSTYPSRDGHSRRGSTSDHYSSSVFGQECSRHSQSREGWQDEYVRERKRDRRSLTDDYTTSSSILRRERGKEHCGSYRDRSPGVPTRHKVQLPVGEATSSRSRCEVVPYASSKASGSTGNRREHCNTAKTEDSIMKVLSVVDSVFIPSLPKKYYSLESDQTTSTELLEHLHTEFEQNLLSIGRGGISPRWQLLHRETGTAQTAVEKAVEDHKQEVIKDGERIVAERDDEREPPITSGVGMTTSLEECLSRQSSIAAVGSSEAASSPLSIPEELKLHQDLSFSVPSEAPQNCTKKYCRYGKRAAVDLNVNPRWYHSYAISVEPTVNFELTGLSRIKGEDGSIFVFQGFSILSHIELDHLPQYKFERCNGIYSIKLHKHPTLTNFTLKDALLCQEFLFVKLLELYDWIEYIRPFATELLFIPRFVRETKDGECQVLSLAEVLDFLIKSTKPVTKFNRRELLAKPAGFLLFSPNKRPSCCRVDEVHTSSRTGDVRLGHWCHQLLSKIKTQSSVQYKAERKRHMELSNKRCERKLTRSEHFELRDLKEILSRGNYAKHHPQEAGMVWLSPHDEVMVTDLYYDVVQHSSLLPLISHHVLVYDSLLSLEEKLGYNFTNPHLLLLAITHPSTSTYTFNIAEDHLKNALANGGIRWYKRLETAPQPKKMKALLAELEKGGDMPVDEGQRLQNNEQLEYLGDALLEYHCSLYLYLKYPDLSVGQLVKRRQNLVKNHFLQELAAKLDIKDYGIFNTKNHLGGESLCHFSGNCIETILGAIFLDGGEEEARKLFGRLAFSEESEYEDWMNPGVDPVKTAYPDGDRHLIKDSDIFQSMVKLEEKCGVTFHHIGLLARAFTHSSHQDKKMTMGNYQRLEFLGDAILQFLVSKYIFLRFPAYNEGHYSMIRTSLVHNKHLSSLCQKLGFHDFIITTESKKEMVEISVKIMADVVESYLGALTLDQGLEVAEQFLEVHMFPTLSEVVRASQLVDSNTRLHQAAVYTCKQQSIKLELPIYKKLGVEGTASSPIYTIAIEYGKKEIARGSSRTLKEARSMAAENALKSGIFRIPP